jgi:hypothetical protein
MQVMLVRNNHLGPTTLEHRSMNGTEEFKWGGRGSAMRDDVIELPDYVVEGANCRRLISKRILTIMNDDAAIAQVDESTKIWIAKQESDRLSTISNMDRRQDNDMVGLGCIGPGERGSVCGTKVLVRNANRNDNPPLCELHKHFTDNFVPEHDGEKVKWMFVQTETTEE